MPKIYQDYDEPIGYQGLSFYCLGCKRTHTVNFHPSNQWQFNGDFEKPTLTPSVLTRYRHPEGYSNDNPAPKGWEGEMVTDVCHSFVTDGNIQYLSDCTHKLAGQTIELPEFTWGDDDD